MERKTFSVGVRIEHRQSMINRSQYGKFADRLPAAEYKLNAKAKNGRGVYTFCMCPGGVVVPAASEEGRLVVNGMSYSGRNLENANSDYFSKCISGGLWRRWKFLQESSFRENWRKRPFEFRWK